ncbi:hypothetical protein [Sphingomonas lenta]|uniref:Uncharacterized protein n=1 Tax=Sphingomonas lenta TaxID=1141887 RepID=A0A2A2SIF5_9SPHN|nr:hypothetical protein [Sphingomonas lenta]PAX09022.1 hypothetical protein CKY28_06725 [Sphingomonas lenta]
MAEATWGDANTPPDIDWRMSASLQNVPRGGEEVAEVTSLESAVRAWLELDDEHQVAALLTPEHPIRLNEGAPLAHFSGEGIRALADRL